MFGCQKQNNLRSILYINLKQNNFSKLYIVIVVPVCFSMHQYAELYYFCWCEIGISNIRFQNCFKHLNICNMNTYKVKSKPNIVFHLVHNGKSSGY